MASANCSIDPDGNPTGCSSAEEMKSGMFLGADATNLSSEISNLSDFMWEVGPTDATPTTNGTDKYSDLNFKFDTKQVVSGSQGGTGTTPYTITLGTNNGANRAFLLNVGNDKTLFSNLNINFENSLDFTYYLKAGKLDGSLTLSNSGKFIAYLTSGITGAISNTGAEATFNITNKYYDLLTTDSITADGGTNNFNFTSARRKLTTVEVNSEISEENSGKNNFTLNSTTSEGIKLVLKGATNQITAFTTFGKKQNTLTITNGATANSISTLTLGTTTGTATDGTLNLSTANALSIGTLEIANTSGTLNIDSNSKGVVTITTATLDNKKTLTLNNQNTTSDTLKLTGLTITGIERNNDIDAPPPTDTSKFIFNGVGNLGIETLTTSKSVALEFKSGTSIIKNKIGIQGDGENVFRISQGATLTLEGGFEAKAGGRNRFFVDGTLSLGLADKTLTTSGADTLNHFDIRANGNIADFYNQFKATNGGKNLIVSDRALELESLSADGQDSINEVYEHTSTSGKPQTSGNFKLTLTGDVTATNQGSNDISANTVKVNDITANNGVNQIGIFSGLTAGTLDAQQAGLNEIRVSNPSTTITLKSMKAQSAGENRITVPEDSGTLTLEGDGSTTPIAMSASGAGSKNYIQFGGNTLNITGNITTDQGGVNELNVNALSLTGDISATDSADSKNIISLGAGNSSVSGNITEASGGQNLFTLDSTSGATSLILEGATNQITTFTATGDANTLTLESTATTNTITNLTLGAKATTGANATPAKNGTLTLSTANTLSINALEIANTSGALNITKGGAEITGGITAGNGVSNTFNIGDGTGNATLTLNGANNTITTLNVKANGVFISNGDGTLTIGTLTTADASSTLTFNKGKNTIEGGVENTQATFNVGDGKDTTSLTFSAEITGAGSVSLQDKATLTLNGGNLKSLSTAGATTVSFASGTTTIEGAITAGNSGDTNTFTLTSTSGTTSATFNGGISGTGKNNFKLDSTAGQTKTQLTLNDASNAINTFTALGGDNKLTITSNTAGTNTIATLNLGGTSAGLLTIANNAIKDSKPVALTINTLTSNFEGSKLTISKGEVAITNTITSTAKNNIALKGATLTLSNGGNLNKLETTAKGENTINLNGGTTTIAGKITAISSVTNNFNIASGATLTLTNGFETSGGTNAFDISGTLNLGAQLDKGLTTSNGGTTSFTIHRGANFDLTGKNIIANTGGKNIITSDGDITLGDIEATGNGSSNTIKINSGELKLGQITSTDIGKNSFTIGDEAGSKATLTLDTSKAITTTNKGKTSFTINSGSTLTLNGTGSTLTANDANNEFIIDNGAKVVVSGGAGFYDTITATNSGKNIIKTSASFDLNKVTADGGTNDITLNGTATGDGTKMTVGAITTTSGENNFTLDSSANAGEKTNLTLKGASDKTITNLTALSNDLNSMNTLTIDQQATGKHTITNLVLGDSENGGKAGFLTIANNTQDKVLTITNFEGKHTESKLTISAGAVNIENLANTGENNNITLTGATLTLNGGKLKSLETKTAGTNTITFVKDTTTITDGINAGSGVTNTINLNNGVTLTSAIKTEDNGTNTITLTGTNNITSAAINGAMSGDGNSITLDSKAKAGDKTNLTLSGANDKTIANLTALSNDASSMNTITIDSTAKGANKIENLNLGNSGTKTGFLTIDNSSGKALTIETLTSAEAKNILTIGASEVIITNAVANAGLSLKGATLTLNNTNGGSTIASLATTGTNTINLKKDTTTIKNEITTRGTNQFNLTGTSNNGTSAVFEGAISGANNFTLDSSGANTKTALTLNGASNAINAFNALGNQNTLTIADTAKGANTIAELVLGNGSAKGLLTIENSSNQALTIETFTSQEVGNILTISKGEVKITNTLQGEHNNIALNDGTTLTLNGGTLKNLTTAGETTINFAKGTTTITDGINAEASVTNNITLEKDVTLNSVITGAGTNNVTLNSATLNPKGTTNTITTLTLSGQSNTINLAGENDKNLPRKEFRLLKVGKTAPQADTGLTNGNNASLTFISYLQDPTKVQGASLGGENASAGSDTYGYAYSDRVIILNAGDNSQALRETYNAKIYAETGLDLSKIQYTQGKGTEQEGNIAILTIAQVNNPTGTTAKEKGIFQLEDKSITRSGLDFIETTLNAIETDENGKVNTDKTKNKYVTYFVGKATAVDPEPEPDPKPPVDPSDPNDPDNDNTGNQGNKPNNGLGNIQQQQKEINSVMEKISFSVIDLYLANFNSLNKRMGELRENNHSQGIWGRVFNGQQGNNLGIQSKTNYITAQAGYDYAFGFEGANNYLGFAISYSHSSGYKSHLTKINQMKLDGFDTQLVELALYNSYVADSGWYNDSIAKASFMMNSISIKDDTPKGINGAKADFNSFALSLSNEFGYRFLLGEDKEWSIDPQAELGVGYINGSDFILKAIDGMKYADMTINSMINLRSRMGASLGYDFKSFIEEKDFKARVYVGLFYEMDYFHFKGDGKMKYKTSRNFIYKIQKNNNLDHRAVLNLGTNLTIKDATRIYLDFEKSFGGKITTNYKINAGVRYSFGENAGYKLKESQINKESESVDSEAKAPLKIKEKGEGGE